MSEHLPYTAEAFQAGLYIPPQEGSELWIQARTLVDFGICTARWLNGEIGPMPTATSYSRPNEEVRDLLPVLVPLNRRGLLVTDFSQPGSTPEDRAHGAVIDYQRAAVSGFTSKELAPRLADTLRAAKLTVIARPVGQYITRLFGEDPRAVVSTSGDQPITYTRATPTKRDIGRDYAGVPGSSQLPGLHKELIRVLQSSVYLRAFDVNYGQSTKLWNTLSRFDPSNS